MNITNPTLSVRFIAAMLVTVLVIGFSAVAMHAPAQNQNWLTLKNIRTDKTTASYVDNRASRGSWFVEMVLPTGDYVDNRASRGSWFVEMVLPTGDSHMATENLKSVAATL
jgi:hypothetical protein